MSSNSSKKLTVPEAQEEFLNIVRKLNDSDNFRELLGWIHWNWLNGKRLIFCHDTEVTDFKRTYLQFANKLSAGIDEVSFNSIHMLHEASCLKQFLWCACYLTPL